MRVPFILPAAAALALAVTACGGGDEPRPAAPEGPWNVLLISLDSARRDLLGVYGGGSPHAPEVEASPRLDSLAREGVVLEDAYATTSWTLPSHVSMLAGVPELVHAVDGDHQRLAEDLPFLPDVLRAHGWRTAGFFSGPYLDPRFGFDRGFARYVACYGDELAAAVARVSDVRGQLEEAEDPVAVVALQSALGAARRRLEIASHRDVSTRRVTDAALVELEAAARDDAPFFLFAHYFDSHYDYLPPEPWDTAFDPEYDGPGGWSDFIRNPRISIEEPGAPAGRRRVIAERDLDNVRAGYTGEMRWIDGELGRLFDRLDELDLAESTLVIVTSDHGDEFFEHGSIGHRRTLHEEVVRVPLLLRLPGTLPAGVRVSGLVSLADLAPTILELNGLDPGDARLSRSFLPLLFGEDDGAERDVIGRLVTTSGVRINLAQPSGARIPVDGRRVRLLETYRRGAIKVTRERTWVQANEGVADEHAREVARLHGAGKREDVLRWIDVVAHPAEADEDHSTDFDEPRARAALRAFHDRYAALLAARSHAPRVEADEDVMSLLRGLGYADDGAPHGGLDDADLLFPPPGHALLGLR